MTITAKFASRCTSCHQPVAIGDRVEWIKGISGVRHTVCGAASATTTTPAKRAYHPTKCIVCGHVERRNSRGYVDGDRILRSGECQSCYEERKMGY